MVLGERGRSGRRRGRLLVALIAAAIALVGAGCVPEPPADDTPPPETPVTTLAVSTWPPAMYPAFSPDVSDYVVRCGGAPLDVRVEAPDAQPVSVGGAPARTGRFTASVWRGVGQQFTVVDQAGSRTYHVRCLPDDYPDFTVTRNAVPQSEYYLIAPVLADASGFLPSYATVFDAHGVPIWWSEQSSIFLQAMGPGQLGWTKWNGTHDEIVGFDRSVITSVGAPAGYSAAAVDFHDMIRLDNGHIVLVLNESLPDQDLSLINGTLTHVPVFDQVLVELDPSVSPPQIVWSWRASDHIDVTETDPQWYAAIAAAQDLTLGSPNYDIYHWNSVEATPTGFLLSFRHLDAVYSIVRDPGQPDDGDILWKLGGVDVPGESLTISGDSVFDTGGFGGQHDARLLPGGTATAFDVTLYDNGTGRSRAPRGVRYAIDTVAGTATLQEQVTDTANAPLSLWGGSARRLAGGSWMLGFGSTNGFSEVAAGGALVFHLTFTGGPLVYRALPVEPGVLDRAGLRAGMDAQYP